MENNPQPSPIEQPSSGFGSHKHYTPFYENQRNVILLVLVMLGVLAYASIFVVLSTQLTAKPKPTPPTVAPSPVPTTNPTANWKTYITMTFSFQYPNNNTVKKVDYDSYFVSQESNSPPIKINQQQDYVGETIDQKIEASKSELKNVKVTKTDYGALITGVLPIMDGIPTAIALVRDKENAIDITQEVSEDQLDVFHKLVASVKLIEPEQSQISNSDLAIIQKTLAQKENVEINKVHISQNQYVGPSEYLGRFASGYYYIVWGKGKNWYAKRENDRWILLYVGNGLPNCIDIAGFNPPKEVLPCVSDTGSE